MLIAHRKLKKLLIPGFLHKMSFVIPQKKSNTKPEHVAKQHESSQTTFLYTPNDDHLLENVNKNLVSKIRLSLDNINNEFRKTIVKNIENIEYVKKDVVNEMQRTYLELMDAIKLSYETNKELSYTFLICARYFALYVHSRLFFRILTINFLYSLKSA